MLTPPTNDIATKTGVKSAEVAAAEEAQVRPPRWQPQRKHRSDVEKVLHLRLLFPVRPRPSGEDPTYRSCLGDLGAYF